MSWQWCHASSAVTVCLPVSWSGATCGSWTSLCHCIRGVFVVLVEVIKYCKRRDKKEIGVFPFGWCYKRCGYLEYNCNPHIHERKWVCIRLKNGHNELPYYQHRKKRMVCLVRSNTWIIIWTKQWVTYCWMCGGGIWLQPLQTSVQ